MAQQVAGEPIQGSWWGHPKGHAIYALTQKIRDSRSVLVCTLAKGRITYIHRRLWPPFVCLSNQFPEHALDRVKEVHLPTGRHKREDIPFPEWVPVSVYQQAMGLSTERAEQEIEIWMDRYGVSWKSVHWLTLSPL